MHAAHRRYLARTQFYLNLEPHQHTIYAETRNAANSIYQDNMRTITVLEQVKSHELYKKKVVQQVAPVLEKNLKVQEYAVGDRDHFSAEIETTSVLTAVFQNTLTQLFISIESQ